MKLNRVKDNPGATKNAKRVGRGIGSGTGKTSGSGHKGQKARSGVSINGFEGGQMPLHRRVPKRGFSNFLFKKEYQIVNICDLENVDSQELNPAILKEKGLIKYALRPIKILGNGEVEKKVKVSASAFSVSAKEKIEKAGGEIIIL